MFDIPTNPAPISLPILILSVDASENVELFTSRSPVQLNYDIRRWNRGQACPLLLCSRLVRMLTKGVGGVCYVAREASFEAKAQEQSPASVGGRRVVVFAGERGIRWANGEFADAEYWSGPRNHSRRGGNLRR